MSIPCSKNRSNFCVFSFADGRRCNMPPVPASDYGLCYFHHQQYIERLNKQYAGEQICLSLPSGISTACDLSVAFAKLFRATALGYIKPKTAHTLTYLGNLMVQTHLLSRKEYEATFEQSWDDVVYDSVCFRKERATDVPPGKSIYPPDPPDDSNALPSVPQADDHLAAPPADDSLAQEPAQPETPEPAPESAENHPQEYPEELRQPENYEQTELKPPSLADSELEEDTESDDPQEVIAAKALAAAASAGTINRPTAPVNEAQVEHLLSLYHSAKSKASSS